MPGSVWPSTDATAAARARRVRGGPRLQTGLHPERRHFMACGAACQFARGHRRPAFRVRLAHATWKPSRPASSADPDPQAHQARSAAGGRRSGAANRRHRNAGGGKHGAASSGDASGGQSGRFDPAKRTGRRLRKRSLAPPRTAWRAPSGRGFRRKRRAEYAAMCDAAQNRDFQICYNTHQVVAMAKILLSATAASESVSSHRDLREITSTKTAHA